MVGRGRREGVRELFGVGRVQYALVGGLQRMLGGWEALHLAAGGAERTNNRRRRRSLLAISHHIANAGVEQDANEFPLICSFYMAFPAGT